MTLADLAERLGVPARQIRFLIAEGILPGASRTGRAADGSVAKIGGSQR